VRLEAAIREKFVPKDVAPAKVQDPEEA
jgi:hypothetical protein